jgi:hypothetical protein
MAFRRRLALRLGIAALVFFLLDLWSLHGFVQSYLVAAVVSTLLAAIVIPFGWHLRLEQRLKGSRAQLVLNQPRTMIFYDFGLHQDLGEDGYSFSPWDFVAFAEVRGGFLLLFTNPFTHVICPLDAFKSDRDREAVMTLLRSKGLLK